MGINSQVVRFPFCRIGGTWWQDIVVTAEIAAAVGIVGILLNYTVLPQLAHALAPTASAPDVTLQVVIGAAETMANNLTNVGGFGLYSLVGLLLLPAVFATEDFPRPLAWLGVKECHNCQAGDLIIKRQRRACVRPQLSVCISGRRMKSSAVTGVCQNIGRVRIQSPSHKARA